MMRKKVTFQLSAEEEGRLAEREKKVTASSKAVAGFANLNDEQCPDLIENTIKLSIINNQRFQREPFRFFAYKALVTHLRGKYRKDEKKLGSVRIQVFNYTFDLAVNDFFKQSLHHLIVDQAEKALNGWAVEALKECSEYDGMENKPYLEVVIKEYVMNAFLRDNQFQRLVHYERSMRNKISELVRDFMGKQQPLRDRLDKLCSDAISSLGKTIEKKHPLLFSLSADRVSGHDIVAPDEVSKKTKKKIAAYNKLKSLQQKLYDQDKDITEQLTGFRDDFSSKATQKTLRDAGDPAATYFLKTAGYALLTLCFGAGLVLSRYKRGTAAFWKGSVVSAKTNKIQSSVKVVPLTKMSAGGS